MIEKIDDFCVDLLANFESICEHMVEKFADKDAKNDNFNNQMEFRKKSIDPFDYFSLINDRNHFEKNELSHAC